MPCISTSELKTKVNKRIMLPTRRLLLIFLCVLFLGSCDEAGWDPVGDDDTGGGGNANARNYFGPNDVWELRLDNDGDFRLTRKNAITDVTPQLTVEGSYETLNTGYTRFSVSNPGASIPSVLSGLQIGDDAVIMMPIQSTNPQILALVSAGECPGSLVEGVWVSYRFRDDANTLSDEESYFGTWRYNPNESDGPVYMVLDDYNLTDMNSNFGGETFNSDDCDDGLASAASYSHYLGNPYSAISIDKDVASTTQFRLGLPETTIATNTSLNGDYVGMMYESEGNNSLTVSLSCTDGACELYEVTSIAIIDKADFLYNINFNETTDQPQQGFVTGTWGNDLIPASNIACAVALDVDEDERTLLACVAQAPGTVVGDAANLFLLSTE